MEELLKLYFSKEVIDDYACDECHERCRCDKVSGFRTMPNCLATYIDRQPQYNQLFGKLNRVVTFSETLDLAPFCVEPGADETYRLYAVVCHLDVAGSTSRSSTAGTETPTPLDLDPPFHPSRLSYRVAVPSVSSDGAAVDGVAFSVAPFDARAAVEVRVEGYPDAASSVRRADETPDRSFQSFAVSLPARPLAPARSRAGARRASTA